MFTPKHLTDVFGQNKKAKESHLGFLFLKRKLVSEESTFICVSARFVGYRNTKKIRSVIIMLRIQRIRV